jgi:hypothetical protein
MVRCIDLQIDYGRRKIEAMNRQGIMYAHGRSVARSYEMAMTWFRKSTLLSYPPAMANLGAMYQMGSTRHRNYRRTYAWLRVALACGVPAPDHDPAVYKLGMLAANIGPTGTARAERLAKGIAAKLAGRPGLQADLSEDSIYEGGRSR